MVDHATPGENRRHCLSWFKSKGAGTQESSCSQRRWKTLGYESHHSTSCWQKPQSYKLRFSCEVQPSQWVLLQNPWPSCEHDLHLSKWTLDELRVSKLLQVLVNDCLWHAVHSWAKQISPRERDCKQYSEVRPKVSATNFMARLR